MAIVCGSPPMMDTIKIYTILSSSVGLKKKKTAEEQPILFEETFLGSNKWNNSKAGHPCHIRLYDSYFFGIKKC